MNLSRWRLGAACGLAGLAGAALVAALPARALGAAALPSAFSGVSFPAWAAAPPAPASRPLLPLLPSSALALAAAFALCILASAAGIGGGAALVPLYLVLAGQGTHAAVALSNLTILGSAAAAFTLNARRWHTPPGDGPPRPLVDWDVILLMEPATVVGAVAGALLNAVSPPAVTLACLTALLGLVTHSLAAKARGVWVAESVARAEALGGGGGVDAGPSLRAHLLLAGEDGGEGGGEAGGGGGGGGGAHPKPPATEVRADGGSGSAPTFPKSPIGVPALLPPPAAAAVARPTPTLSPPPLPAAKVGALVSLFAVVLACDALKGRLRCGSLAYWLATVGIVPPALALTAWARAHILAGVGGGGVPRGAPPPPAEAARAEEEGAGTGHTDTTPPPPPSQLAWTPANTLAIPAISTLAGLAAGAFGVGGGIIKGPFLILVARLPPEVAAATAMTMILFTSATASLVYLAAGAASPAWGGAVFAVGLLGAAVGVAGLGRAIEASGGRRSLVVVAMTATLGVSLVATAWQTVVAVRAGEVGRGRLC